MSVKIFLSYNPTDASRAQQMHLQTLNEMERYPALAGPNLAKQIAYTTILDLLRKTSRSSCRASRFPYAAIVAVLFLLLLTPFAADHLAKRSG